MSKRDPIFTAEQREKKGLETFSHPLNPGPSEMRGVSLSEAVGLQRIAVHLAVLPAGRLRVPVADSLVLGENCPAAASDFRQPYLVGRVLREVVVVNFDESTCDSQDASYDVSPEAPIHEEDLAHAARRRFSQRMASSIERRWIS